ncbi:molybdate ABC transporter substrate-binding protein [Polaromonas sp. YR568]|uniref:molybdate ABC transporter substrate-binding protein n=1 Tax=Polaromonas sp. YR568 TaxID=1855301 RepID=UPI0031380457
MDAKEGVLAHQGLWRSRRGGILLLAISFGVGLALTAGGVRAQSPAGDIPQGKPTLVAAAANLQPALAELVPLFERQQAGRIALSLGASSNLVRQIQQGLPAELFLSADEDFAIRLHDAGLTTDRGVVYATGRIVLVVPKVSSLALDASLQGLKAAAPGLGKFAIANPELAPYGRAARQALEKQGIWPALQPKLVIGENIAQTTQYVSTGSAQAGITALSLVLAPAVAGQLRHVVISDDLHAPIRQRMVLMKTASPGARAFYDFLQSPAARAVLLRHGYQ